MKRLIQLIICPLLFVTCSEEPYVPSFPDKPQETTRSFPGAEGAGSFTTGGREGKVVYVTNLEDSGSGSLRSAVLAGPYTTVVFAVSGTISLRTPLYITSPYLTIAGQTAPGEGITIKNSTTYVRASNVIIQFIRFRMGDGAQGVENQAEDAVEGQNCSNLLLDHCSMSWNMDECASFYDNTNMTMQWCIISESLRYSQHPKGAHGYGGMWGGRNVTFHHNLLAHHDSRNPRFCGARFSAKPDEEKVDFRNNVIYNWGGNSGYGGEGGQYNIVNNYYKPGPASSNRARIFAPDSDPTNGGDTSPLTRLLGGLNKPCWGKFYVSGNYMDGKGANWDWNGIEPQPKKSRDGDLTAAQAKEQIKLNAEVKMTDAPINTQSAQDAYNSVLEFAGASYSRDAVDLRIVDNVRNGDYTPKVMQINTAAHGDRHSTNGLIDSQKEVGGYPNLNDGAETKWDLPTYDTDLDGIPNTWETENGLNPNDVADGRTKTLDPEGNYTNLELYLHSIVRHLYP